MSALLCKLDITAQHEGFFNPQPYRPHGVKVWLESDYRVESSWMAAPEIGEFPRQVSVLHLVRDPLESIRSFVGIRFLTDEELAVNTYTQFAQKHCPEAFTPATSAERAMAFWYRWNGLVEKQAVAAGLACWRMKLGEIQPESLAFVLSASLGVTRVGDRIRSAMDTLGSRVNHRHRDERIQWADIPQSDTKREAEAMATRYGYAGYNT